MRSQSQALYSRKRAGLRLLSLGGVAAVILLAISGTQQPTESSTPLGPHADLTDGVGVDERAVRVRDALLVVNRDGSATVAAYLQSAKDSELALTGVAVSVNRQGLAVSSTEMWLPIPADSWAQVGAASDAGGFSVPDGIGEAAHASVEFRFDDGTCVLAYVTAVARTDRHRLVYPKNGKQLGAATTDRLAGRGSPCKYMQFRRV